MTTEKSNKEEGKEMSFLAHLEELRWHLVRSVIVIVVLSIVAFVNGEFIFEEILFAPRKSFVRKCTISI